MSDNSEIYGICRHKTTFRRFFPITDDPILTGGRVSPYKVFKILIFNIFSGCFSTEVFLINHLQKTKLNRTL